MKLERKIPMSFSGWVVSMNAALASREAIVPCNIYAVQKRAHGLKLQIPLTSCLVSVSTSPAALTWTWTVTATRRTTMTGTVREPWRLLTFACVSVQEVDSSSPLAPTPHPPLASAVCFTAVRRRRVRSSITMWMQHNNIYWETCRSHIVTN